MQVVVRSYFRTKTCYPVDRCKARVRIFWNGTRKYFIQERKWYKNDLEVQDFNNNLKLFSPLFVNNHARTSKSFLYYFPLGVHPTGHKPSQWTSVKKAFLKAAFNSSRSKVLEATWLGLCLFEFQQQKQGQTLVSEVS